MAPQTIGLLMLPAILFLAFVINYFDRRLKSAGEQCARPSTDSHSAPSTGH